MDARLDTETRVTGSWTGPAASRALVPGLTILCHPELERVGERVSLPALGSGRSVELSRLEPSFAQPGASGGRPLGDSHLSRRPIRLSSTGDGGVIDVDRLESSTRVEIDGEPLVDTRRLEPEAIERGVVVALGSRTALLLHPVPPVSRATAHPELVGESVEIQRLVAELTAIAAVDVPVLLRGETGTGKELVARALHRTSPRRGAPFVAVSLAAIPPSLAASELFGAEKGAFTGADRRRDGVFVCAERGTLFLDEVGEAPGDLQALLLRALETREIQPVGGGSVRRVDVRIVAATDADLESAIDDDRFKAPLLHRLAGYELRLPALRARRDDIPRLFFHFLRRELDVLGVPLDEPRAPWRSSELIGRLVRRPWTGNVRELRNVARRFALAGRTGSAVDLGPSIPDRASALPASDEPSSPPTRSEPARSERRKPSEVGDDELLEVLRRHEFRLKPTARALRISRASLYVLVERCPRVRKAADLEAAEIRDALRRAGGDRSAAAARLEVSAQGLKRRMTALGLGR